MRDIKFRGKRADNGQWVYGYLIKDCDDNKFYITNTRAIYHEVNPDTIGQYTGLKDINNKEIYEGNIVLISMSMIYGKPIEQNCKVWFEERLSSFVCNWGNNPPVRIGSFCNTAFEVIGNIYDNPGLVKND